MRFWGVNRNNIGSKIHVAKHYMYYIVRHILYGIQRNTCYFFVFFHSHATNLHFTAKTVY